MNNPYMIYLLAGLSTGLIMGFVLCFLMLVKAVIQCTLNNFLVTQRLMAGGNAPVPSVPVRVKGLHEASEENKAKLKEADSD